MRGVSGKLRVNGVALGSLAADGSVKAMPDVACDLVLMAGGWTPAVHLFSQSRGKLKYDAARQIYLPGTSAQAEQSAGACNGTFELAAALAEGHAAGAAAAGTPSTRRFAADGAITPAGGFHGAVPHGRDPQKVKAFVDFQNDVTAKDIKLAVLEGMHSIEHIKRYTTTGMATDQGKTSNMNGLAIASAALDKPIPDIGLTTFRPPLHAGDLRHARRTCRAATCSIPIRKTPMHDWAVAQGAVFEDVGQWKRAWYFPQPGEEHAAGRRRASAGRRAQPPGCSTRRRLGKIEIVGPDAAEFMERLYTNPWQKLGVGRCRYGADAERSRLCHG